MLDLIGQNLGIAIVPAPIAAKRPDSLHATPLEGDLSAWTVATAVPDRPSPAAQAFLGSLSGSLERSAAWQCGRGTASPEFTSVHGGELHRRELTQSGS
jgi:DNA-binding transcriptional LysR family regulator